MFDDWFRLVSNASGKDVVAFGRSGWASVLKVRLCAYAVDQPLQHDGVVIEQVVFHRRVHWGEWGKDHTDTLGNAYAAKGSRRETF